MQNSSRFISTSFILLFFFEILNLHAQIPVDSKILQGTSEFKIQEIKIWQGTKYKIDIDLNKDIPSKLVKPIGISRFYYPGRDTITILGQTLKRNNYLNTLVNRKNSLRNYKNRRLAQSADPILYTKRNDSTFTAITVSAKPLKYKVNTIDIEMDSLSYVIVERDTIRIDQLRQKISSEMNRQSTDLLSIELPGYVEIGALASLVSKVEAVKDSMLGFHNILRPPLEITNAVIMHLGSHSIKINKQLIAEVNIVQSLKKQFRILESNKLTFLIDSDVYVERVYKITNELSAIEDITVYHLVNKKVDYKKL